MFLRYVVSKIKLCHAKSQSYQQDLSGQQTYLFLMITLFTLGVVTFKANTEIVEPRRLKF